MCYLIVFEKHAAPKSDHMKENGDTTNQRSSKKLQPDNSAFGRSHIQGVRGPGMCSPPLKNPQVFLSMK